MGFKINEMIAAGEKHLRDQEYAEGTKRQYREIWRKFAKYCTGIEVTDPCREEGVSFLASRGIVSGIAKSAWQRQQRRYVMVLFDLAEKGTVPLAYGKERILLPACFSHVHAAYENHIGSKGLNPRTIYGKRHLAKKFLCYLEGIGLKEIEGIRADNVYGYLSSLDCNTSSSRSAHLFFLREFLRFLVEAFGAEASLSRMFPVILVNKDDVLPSVYSPEEIRRTLSSLDDSSRCARRNRALVLLAMQLGMRAGDIKGLTKDQIDWQTKKLCFHQQKTGRQVVLPLPDESMYAILDYLKNERPPSEDPHIFITSRAPYRQLANSNSLHSIISGCYERADVEVAGKHRGMHSLRHSAAVNMLLADTPLPVLVGILGHESSNMTRGYLRMDVERLRPLSLEVPYVR